MTKQQPTNQLNERRPDKSLEARFSRFLEGLPGAESIDQMSLPDDPIHRRKADFLLAHRQVIVELKSLTEDTSHKIEALAEKHRERKDWPLFYGRADVRKVLQNLPDGEAIYGKMINAIGRSIETVVRSAEEQVTHTKLVLNLPNAATLLVILNESIDVLDPYFVGHRVAQLMRRPRTGSSSSEKLDFVLLLFESHSMGLFQGRPTLPCMLITGETKDRFPWFSAFHHDLVRRWANANGAISVEAEATDPAKLQFSSIKDLMAPPPDQLPLHEVWRRQYHARPYMRALGDEDVIARGAEILRQVTPHFLEGGPGYVAEVVIPSMESFAHFVEEMNFRGLDMRRLPRL
jgi:hypothetical protein